ncbi:MAG: hypothetical protein KGQ59_12000 [Bdellovibrionales bacterium]|nr:hypothetical protein [Bdellovibrionales bacterium]
MKKRITILVGVLVLVLFQGATAWARSLQGIQVQIEPVVGYERAYKPQPQPHTKMRFLYGVRASAGYSYLSAEIEASRASDSEAYPAQVLTIDETAEKVKLGLRSGFDRPHASFFFRAGGQAQWVSRTTSLVGVSTTTKDPLSIDPYAGIGSEIGGPHIRLTGSATVVFQDFNAWSRNELQTTVGVKIGK